MSANPNRKIGVQVFVDASGAQVPLDQLKTDIASIGPSANASMGAVATASQGAGSGVANLTSRITLNKAAISELNSQIGNSISAYKQYGDILANMNAAQSANTTGVAKLQAAQAAELDNLNQLTGQKAALVQVTNTLAGSTKTLAAVESIEAETSGISATQAIRTGVALDRISGISVGAGRSLSILASGFAAASLGQLALIAGAALLVGALVESFRSKQKDIELTYEQIKANQQLLASQQTGNQWTKTLAQTLHDEAASREQVKQKLVELHIARAQEGDAIAHENRSLQGLADTQSNLISKVAAYIYTQVASTKAESQATADREKAQKSLEDVIQSRVTLWAETNRTIQSLKDELSTLGLDKQSWDELTGAIDRGSAAEARFSAGHSTLGRLRQQVALSAAEAGKTLTHAEAQQLLALQAEKEGVTGLLNETELADKNMKAFAETHHSTAAAIRSVDNSLDELGKRAADAMAALAGPKDFDAQRKKITADIEAEESILLRNHKYSLQQRQDVTDEFAAIRLAKVTEVNNKEMAATVAWQDKMNTLRIQGMKDGYDKDIALMDQQAKKTYDEQIASGASVATAQSRADEERWNIHDRWLTKMMEENEKYDAKFLSSFEKTNKLMEAAELDLNKKTLDAAVKNIAALNSLNKGFGTNLHIFSPQDVQEATALTNALARLNPALANLGKGEQNSVAFTKDLGVAMRTLDNEYRGSAANQAQLLNRLIQTTHQQVLATAAVGKDTTELKKQELELRRLQQTTNSASQSNHGFLATLQDLSLAYRQQESSVESLAQVVSSAWGEMAGNISSAFNSIVSSGLSFSAAMETIMLKEIGSMAQHWGEYWILDAAGWIWANPARAAEEFAAGGALLALGGALEGLAGNIGGAGSKAGSSAAAAAGASSGGSASSTINKSPNTNKPPIFVPINASGQTKAPVNVFKLDKEGTKAFLEGQGVITEGSAGHKHKNLLHKIARNAIKTAN